MKKEKYKLISAVRYNNQRTAPGEIVELTEEEARRMCLLGAIALSPIKETPPKKVKEDLAESPAEETKPAPTKDPPTKTKEG